LERVKPLLSVFPRFFLGHPYSQTSHLTFIWGGKFHNQPLVFVWSWGHATYIIQIPSKVGTDQSALKGFSSSFVLNIFVLTLAISSAFGGEISQPTTQRFSNFFGTGRFYLHPHFNFFQKLERFIPLLRVLPRHWKATRASGTATQHNGQN